MSDINTKHTLINAAKQLAESEIQLIKKIESNNESKDEPVTTENNSSAVNEQPSKMANAKPSPAVVAAKREAKRAFVTKNSNTVVRDIYQKAIDSKNMIRRDTGIVYDPSMMEHCCLWDKNYPECPERYIKVMKRCEELGLIKRCKNIAPRYAEFNELLLKHTPAHIELLKSTENVTDLGKLEELASKYDAIYFHPSTYRLALLAAGSTINLVENICKGNIQNGMAIIRPPGHHAMKAEYCGYCFFNNVAIAAEIVLRNNLCKKILIVDWDVHHGQATQKMFYNDPRVVYFSIHRYEHGTFWPYLKESDYHYIGDKSGEGYNFNVPLNDVGMTNGDYIAIFQQVLLPMAYEFQPDLIIVSAGYDAALGCPEGMMTVTPACFGHLLNSLLCLASGRVAVVLEGGYCTKSLAESAAICLKTLLGDPCPMLEMLEPPCKSVQESILNTIYSHKFHWDCYNFQETYVINTTTHTKQPKHLPIIVFKGPTTATSIFETRNCYPVQTQNELQMINMELDILIKNTNLNKALNKVCLVYDERMLKHCNIDDEFHPEKPDRIQSIYSKHKDYNLLKRCFVIEGRIAKESELMLAHSQDYINNIKATSTKSLEELSMESKNLNSVYLHPETWNSARISTGSLLQVVDTVLNGEAQSGIAIVRPPGHHAKQNSSCGFCIFNNVAIAAKYAVSFYNLKRVLIVDWDIHHGNGTQSMLQNSSQILYISLHRYDEGTFFPHSKLANYVEVGVDEGEGFNVNIPWNRKGMGDAEYIAAFQQVVMPIAYQFNPELILISAGFDACIGDPLGGFKVSPEMYGHMTYWLSSLANRRVILTLEGGYNVNSIAHAMTICTKTLLGDPLMSLDPDSIPCQSAIATINNVLWTQKEYWPNLSFQMSLPSDNIIPKPKVPRPKPITRLSSREEFPNIDLKDDLEMAESQLLNRINQLDFGLEDLKIKESANNRKISNDLSKSDEDFTSLSSGSVAQATVSLTSTVTLQSFIRENTQALLDKEMFMLVPQKDCPHLESVFEVPETGIDIEAPCHDCATNLENWVCLQCYKIYCARNVNKHALKHREATNHSLTLSFKDISVWCYECEAYIDHPKLYPARNAVHQKKFKDELLWTYHNKSLNLL